jgi:hypothetical protein
VELDVVGGAGQEIEHAPCELIGHGPIRDVVWVHTAKRQASAHFADPETA